MKSQILIHPGFHKTGTTFLQDVVFGSPAYFVKPWSRSWISAQLIEPHELVFDAASVKMRIAEDIARIPAGVLPVLSEEGLCGNPFNGARESTVLARKLYAVFDNAKILLTVRGQRGMLRAVYVQYLKAFGRRRPETFFDPPRYPEFSAFDPDIYQFHRLAEYYAGLFGRNNVLVLPQELLQHEPRRFLKLLGDFTGTDLVDASEVDAEGEGRNVSPDLGGMRFMRFGNHFVPSAFNEHDLLGSSNLCASVFRSLGYRKLGLFSADARRMAETLDGYRGHYARSNALLQDFCPVDLAACGYEMTKLE